MTPTEPPFGARPEHTGIITSTPRKRYPYDDFTEKLGKLVRRKGKEKEIAALTKKELGVALSKRRASQLWLILSSTPPSAMRERLLGGSDKVRLAIVQALRRGWPRFRGKPSGPGADAEAFLEMVKGMQAEIKKPLPRGGRAIRESELAGLGLRRKGPPIPPEPRVLPPLPEAKEEAGRVVRFLRRAHARRRAELGLGKSPKAWENIAREVAEQVGGSAVYGIHKRGYSPAAQFGERPEDFERVKKVITRAMFGGQAPPAGSLLDQQLLKKAVLATGARTPQAFDELVGLLSKETLTEEEFSRAAQRFAALGAGRGRQPRGLGVHPQEKQFDDEPWREVKARRGRYVARALAPSDSALRHRIREILPRVNAADAVAYGKTREALLTHGAVDIEKMLGPTWARGDERKIAGWLRMHKGASLQKKMAFLEDVRRYTAARAPGQFEKLPPGAAPPPRTPVDPRLKQAARGWWRRRPSPGPRLIVPEEALGPARPPAVLKRVEGILKILARLPK
jgi:hypothetical protein